jgi:hypothetical protein
MTSVPTLLPMAAETTETALPESISELTQALQMVLQQYLPFIPEEVSVFFGGAEVYRYTPADDSVCWWGGYWSDPEAPIAPTSES